MAEQQKQQLESYGCLISPAANVRDDTMRSSSTSGFEMLPNTSTHRRRFSVVLGTAIAFGLLLLLAASSSASFCLSFECRRRFSMDLAAAVAGGNNIGSSGNFAVPHRKLLVPAASHVKQPDRIWGEKRCTKSDLVIIQGPTDPLPNGIPTYTVEIMNACITKDCHISHIHLNCGWFSSARLIDPRIFKRLRFDNCLVNNGKPLTNGDSITFQYANTFPYRLSVSSIHC